jgi:hypothetical protein
MKLFGIGLVARVLGDHDTSAIPRLKEVEKNWSEAKSGVLPPVKFAPGFTI